MDGVWRRAAAVDCVRPAAYVLTDGDFVGVHVWFDELPLRRHLLTVAKCFLDSLYCCYSGTVCTMWQISATILEIQTVWFVAATVVEVPSQPT